MDIYSIEAISETVLNWAQTRPEISALALVGSYARGEATADSDIDLMTITSKPDIFRKNGDWIHQINWESINCKILAFKDAQYGAVWSKHIYLNKYTAKYSTNLNNHLTSKLKIEISFGLAANLTPFPSPYQREG